MVKFVPFVSLRYCTFLMLGDMLCGLQEFELLIDIDHLISKADTDDSGFIDYDEFKNLLSTISD